MGTEICKNCNSDRYIFTEKNLSNRIIPDDENNINQMNHLINGQNNLDKFENNIGAKLNNNENNLSNYDNPLYNTSLEESMNLGNCYIGTNKNTTKIKPYNPENSLQTVMNKKRLCIELKTNSNNDFIAERKINQTLKNYNKKNIKYNILFNNNKEIMEKNISEKGFYYNNSNMKNKKNFNNMVFLNDTSQNNNNMNKSLDNFDKLIQKSNTKNVKNKTKKIFDLNEKVPETYEEENMDKLKNLYIQYNLKILKKIISKIILNKKKNIENNIDNKDNNIDDDNNKVIKQYQEKYETFNDVANFEELDVNLVPEKKHIFIGLKINNLKNGFGLDIFKTFNSYYFGQFVNGKRVGIAKYTINYKNSNYKYEGEIEGFHASGYGRYINYETNLKYEGEWKNSLKDGIGIEEYNNNLYQGNFLKGKRNGIGKYFWEKDIYYHGEWNDNLMEGRGIYYFSKDAFYEGNFKNNKIEGFGILNVKYSKIYVGFFKNDFKNGFGMKIWDNEKKAYVGFWKDNKQDGFGKLFKNDKIRYATYNNGKIVNEIKDNDQINKILNDINKFFSLLFELRNYKEVKEKVYEFVNM